jgi:hypothetical protein
MSYLETAHRNIAWFNARFRDGELEIRPPFQRNPVWTNAQKAYLIDTILRGLPIPELYMQEIVDPEGNQSYIVVDGQQRVRAFLEYLESKYSLDPKHSQEWGDVTFEELSGAEKQKIFQYKFVVRTLPDLTHEQLRDIFKRLNRSVVSLNAQELRHATYWGPFIKFVEHEAEENDFWADSGLFSANAIRRMLDVEFISELAVAYLHGLQDKKKKLENYYQLYEESFEREAETKRVFRKVTSEIEGVLGTLRKTRWRKQSDFYSLFSVFARNSDCFPLTREARESVRVKLLSFGSTVDEFLSIQDQAAEEDRWSRDVRHYAVAVSRAASDIVNRRTRDTVLARLVLPELQRNASNSAQG